MKRWSARARLSPIASSTCQPPWATRSNRDTGCNNAVTCTHAATPPRLHALWARKTKLSAKCGTGVKRGGRTATRPGTRSARTAGLELGSDRRLMRRWSRIQQQQQQQQRQRRSCRELNFLPGYVHEISREYPPNFRSTLLFFGGGRGVVSSVSPILWPCARQSIAPNKLRQSLRFGTLSTKQISTKVAFWGNSLLACGKIWHDPTRMAIWRRPISCK
mmetsp:Transcript_51991/g.130538  ORF Transcript_51991/g.130538 Transcript_51991/m.130538 type:complete len:218 (+) Transcript_51991:360-1013(+)